MRDIGEKRCLQLVEHGLAETVLSADLRRRPPSSCLLPLSMSRIAVKRFRLMSCAPSSDRQPLPHSDEAGGVRLTRTVRRSEFSRTRLTRVSAAETANDTCFSDTRSWREIGHTQVKLCVPEQCNVPGQRMVYFEHEVAASLIARADRQRNCPTLK